MRRCYTKSLFLERLDRLEGQVRGIARTVEEDRYCVDVVTQIGAIPAAIDKVARAMGAVARLLKTG